MGRFQFLVPSRVSSLFRTFRTVACASGLLFGWATAHGLDRTGLVAEFLFDNSLMNTANGSTPLDRPSAQLVKDRFNRPSSALRAAPLGFVASTQTDFLKNVRRWSWAGWIRFDAPLVTQPQAIYSEGNRGVSLSIYYQDGGLNVSTWNESLGGNWRTLTAVVPIVPGEWHHLAVTFNAANDLLGQCTLYYDGELVGAGAIGYVKATDWRASVHELAFLDNVGAVTGGDVARPFRGSLDDVYIFQRVLSAAEVHELHTAPQPLDPILIHPAVELEFFAPQGHQYQVQSSIDLVTWTNEGEPVTGTGQAYRRLVSTFDRPNTFWRLQPVVP